MTYDEQVAAVRPRLPLGSLQALGGVVGGAAEVKRAAAAGVSGAPTALPHAGELAQALGPQAVSGIRAFVGGPAAQACDAIGATAYAFGDQVAFKSAPNVFTAAHEVAHVVQQRAGVPLLGGVGRAGDAYERHADAVADRVVQGRSATELLDARAGSASDRATTPSAVQRSEDEERTWSASPGDSIVMGPAELMVSPDATGAERVLALLDAVEHAYRSGVPPLASFAEAHSQRIISACAGTVSRAIHWAGEEGDAALAFQDATAETLLHAAMSAGLGLLPGPMGHILGFVYSGLSGLWMNARASEQTHAVIEQNRFITEQLSGASEAIIRHFMEQHGAHLGTVNRLHGEIDGLFGTDNEVELVRGYVERGLDDHALRHGERVAQTYYELFDTFSDAVDDMGRVASRALMVGHAALNRLFDLYLAYKGMDRPIGTAVHLAPLDSEGSYGVYSRVAGIGGTAYRSLTSAIQERLVSGDMTYGAVPARLGLRVRSQVSVAGSRAQSAYTGELTAVDSFLIEQDADGRQTIGPLTLEQERLLASLIVRDTGASPLATRVEERSRREVPDSGHERDAALAREALRYVLVRLQRSCLIQDQ
jgi:hypothetical protein